MTQHRKLSRRCLAVCVAAALILLPLVFPISEALAAPPRHKQAPPRHRPAPHQTLHRGTHVRVLPRRHVAVRVGPRRFFYHRGTFYRRAPSGFVVVRAPIGAVVLSLPLGFLRVVVGGAPYYWYGGVYYQRVPSGYAVVEAPPQAEASTPVGGSVSVVAYVLNVRSGPGTDHPVVQQVSRGTVLVVRGDAPGWLYVELPNGTLGWVMTVFTTHVPPPASG